MEFRTYPSKHGKSYLVILNSHLYSGPIFLRFLSLISLFQTLDFLSYPSTGNIGILALSLYALEFLFHPFKRCNSGPIFTNNGNLILSFQNWSSGPILMRIGFLICPFERLGFWLYFYKHWNYACKHWDRGSIL